MRRALVILALIVLGACQTLPAVVLSGGETFYVRYDPRTQQSAEADARADRHCNGEAEFVGEAAGFEGLSHRSYRCKES